MKKLFVLALATIMIVGLNCTKACQKSNEQKKVLRIGTNANFPPFETIDKNGGLIGFDIDMGRAIAQELGLKPEFREFDFDALILALKKGQIDMIMSGMSITKSRLLEIAMVPYQGKPITEIALVFWGKIPSNITTLEDVKNLSQKDKLAVSVQSGHFLEGYLKNEAVDIKPLVGPPEQILDIKYKKSLAAALDLANARDLSKRHQDLSLLLIKLPEEKWDLGNGIGIKKENTELFKRVEKAVEDLKERGVVEALEKKWLEVNE